MAALRFAVLIGAVLACAAAQEVVPPLGWRQRAALEQQWTNERVFTVLPALMKENDVAMWLLAMREYGEDTVFTSIKSSTQFAARRRTVILFYFDEAGAFQRSDFVDNTDQVWVNVREVIARTNPATIALNVDADWAFSDGLHAGEMEEVQANLAQYASRFVRRPNLGVDFIATRVPSMLPTYRDMMQSAWAIIKEGFSRKVITPGVTTTDDLVWWFRDRIQAANFTTWFQPSVDVHRPGYNGGGIIYEGDMLWTDFGLTAYGLNTDTQHNAYVLRSGETQAPAFLLQGLRTANVLQDLVRKHLVVGRTGNQVLTATLDEMRALNITGAIYSHPIGTHGHGAGPLIGYINIQEPVPVRGDALVRPNTWFSVELAAYVFTPEWNMTVTFRQEEDVYIDDQGNNNWVYGRQTDFHLC